MCNYRAMNPEKLQRCIHELQNKHGDAWERVVSKGESVDAHLSAALSTASMKGLGDLPDLEAGEEGEPRPPAPSPASGLVHPIRPMMAFDAKRSVACREAGVSAACVSVSV